MSFVKPFLVGYKNMVKASSDIDRLKCMPQRLEDGKLIDFAGKVILGGIQDVADMEVIEAARINDASRYTAALQRDYFAGLDVLLSKFDGSTVDVDDAPVDAVVALYSKLYDIVETGDKKGFRAIRTELKDQWFALDAEVVSDAILDLADAVADKDVNLAKEIVEGIDDEPETEAPTAKEEPELKETPKKSKAKLTEEESEIIEDLKSAIDDGDQKDIDELLAELKEVNKALYDEWLPATQVEVAEDTPEEEETEDDNIADEIIDDLDAAIADEDVEEAKACLEELADEVGKDSELYKVNAAKLAPKKETRKSRRGK